MSRYKFEEVEWDDTDLDENGGSRRSAKRRAEEPRRSPIRRKDKLRAEEGVKSKAKRNHRKLQNKIKYDWQGE